MNQSTLIIVAPILSDPNTVVIYRDNGEELAVKINKETKTLSSSIKISIEEVNFIKENYL